MALRKTKKKRDVSRPLSPTHKRRRSAPPFYDQFTGDTRQLVLQRPRRSTVADHVPHLQHSDLQSPRTEDDVLSNQFSVIGVTPSQAPGGSSSSISWLAASQTDAGTDMQRLSESSDPISDISNHDESLPRAVFRVETEAVCEPLARVEPRESAKLYGNGPLTGSRSEIAIEEDSPLNSRDSLLLSDFSVSRTWIDLRLPLSNHAPPIIRKPSGIIADSTGTLASNASIRTSDSETLRLSKRDSSYQRLLSGYSQKNRSFEKTSRPRCNPPFYSKAGDPETDAQLSKGLTPALGVPGPTSHIFRPISGEKAPGDQERESSHDVFLGDLIEMHDGQSSLIKTSGSSSRSSSRLSSLSSIAPKTPSVSETASTKTSMFRDVMAGVEAQPSSFFKHWKDTYMQYFPAPEPLRVFPVLTENEVPQGRNDNGDDVERETERHNDPCDLSETSTYTTLNQWRFPTGVSPCEVQEEIRSTSENGISPTRNSNRRGTASGEHTSIEPINCAPVRPAQVPGLDGDASYADPSLEAGVYHHMMRVTSSTPEPALENETGPSKPRQAGRAHQSAEPTSSRQQKTQQKIQPPHLLGERSEGPSQDAAPIPSQVVPPGLTHGETNQRVVGQNLAEEAQGRQEHEDERQRNQQRTAKAERERSDSVQDWMASTPPRRFEGMRCRRGPLRAASSSDEVGCCFCQCLTPLRSLCCGRRGDKDGLFSLCKQSDPLTQDRLRAHRRRTGEPNTSGCRGSTAVVEATPASDEQNDGSRLQHQGNTNESTVAVETPESATPAHPGLVKTAANTTAIRRSKVLGQNTTDP
ncbi:MAG: hypothetical protein Q9216_004052 [Gyalolechia sp. 2 TL-2023]